MALYRVGFEPPKVKARMELVFSKLDGAYPDKVIRGLHKEHKKWGETCTEISRQLGYANTNDFLTAYGYTIERATAGRKKKDETEVLEELKRRYPNGSGLSRFTELVQQNPDLKGRLKTLNNSAQILFGMTLSEYFVQIGLLEDPNHAEVLEELLSELKKRYPAGAELPGTLDQLKADNPGLKMHRLGYIKEVYGCNVREHLIRIGLLPPAEPVVPRFIVAKDDYDGCIRILKQRYADQPKPEKLNELINENPDLPIRQLNRHIRALGKEKKTEHFYIRNRIMQGKDTDLIPYIYCGIIYVEGYDDEGKFNLERAIKYYGENGIDFAIEYYRTRVDIYQVGDYVYLEDYSGYRKGIIARIIHCIGLDAPWPVERTKEVCGKVRLPMSRKEAAEQMKAMAAEGEDEFHEIPTVTPENPKGYVRAKRRLMDYVDLVLYDPVQQLLRMEIPIQRCRFSGVQSPEVLKLGGNENRQILDSSGKQVGQLPEDALRVLEPMVQGGYAAVGAVRARSSMVELEIRLYKSMAAFKSAVLIRAGDWPSLARKELTILWTDIPAGAARALFDIQGSWDGTGSFAQHCDLCVKPNPEKYTAAAPFLEELKDLGLRKLFEEHAVNEERCDFRVDRELFDRFTWDELCDYLDPESESDSEYMVLLKGDTQPGEPLDAQVISVIELQTE